MTFRDTLYIKCCFKVYLCTGFHKSSIESSAVFQPRFDCGMGEGILISDQPVVLSSWNTLTIYRDRWDAWMQLNSGSQVQGRSKVCEIIFALFPT